MSEPPGKPLPSLVFFPMILAVEGDNCVFDGVIYQSGETFQPSCKYQCACQDGQVGCVPRCEEDLLLPQPDCPAPRKVKVPGECCEKWICDSKETGTLGGCCPSLIVMTTYPHIERINGKNRRKQERVYLSKETEKTQKCLLLLLLLLSRFSCVRLCATP